MDKVPKWWIICKHMNKKLISVGYFSIDHVTLLPYLQFHTQSPPPLSLPFFFASTFISLSHTLSLNSSLFLSLSLLLHPLNHSRRLTFFCSPTTFLGYLAARRLFTCKVYTYLHGKRMDKVLTISRWSDCNLGARDTVDREIFLCINFVTGHQCYMRETFVIATS